MVIRSLVFCVSSNVSTEEALEAWESITWCSTQTSNTVGELSSLARSGSDSRQVSNISNCFAKQCQCLSNSQSVSSRHALVPAWLVELWVSWPSSDDDGWGKAANILRRTNVSVHCAVKLPCFNLQCPSWPQRFIGKGLGIVRLGPLSL